MPSLRGAKEWTFSSLSWEFTPQRTDTWCRTRVWKECWFTGLKKTETIIPHLPLQALHWGEWWYFLQNLVLQELSEVIRATLLHVGVIITLQYTLPHCWNKNLNSNFPPIVHISRHYEDFIVWHILLLFQISVCAGGLWQPLLFVTQLPTHKSVVDLNRLYVTITC